MIVDAPAIVRSHLVAESAVTDIVGSRVVDQTPASVTDAWVCITLIAAPDDPMVPFDYLVPFTFQIDCYAADGQTQVEANLLARTVRASLKEMPFATHSGAVVSNVRTVGMAYIPDTDLEPARDRYALTTVVVAHSA